MNPHQEQSPYFTIDDKGKWDINIPAAVRNGLHILIGGPCYDAIVRCTTHASDMKLHNLLTQHGINHGFSDLYNESYCARGRNVMAATCLKDGYTHFFSRDADIEYNPQDILRMIAMNLNMVGMVYPKKGINWTRCFLYAQEHQARLQNLKPEELAEELEAHSLDYVLVKDDKQHECNGAKSVKYIGDGALLIKREAFQRMIDAGISPKMKAQQFPDLEGFYFGHFTESIVAGEELSCDYSCEHRWRLAGGTVWAYPRAKVNHLGSYNFKGGCPLA